MIDRMTSEGLSAVTFGASWLLSSLVSVIPWRTSSFDLPVELYGAAGDRRATPIELLATLRSFRSVPALKAIGVRNHWSLLPPGAKVLGSLVDMLFCISLACLVCYLFNGASAARDYVIKGWIAIGLAFFLFHVLWLGEIGRIGYHLRFLLSALLGPLMLPLHFFVYGRRHT